MCRDGESQHLERLWGSGSKQVNGQGPKQSKEKMKKSEGKGYSQLKGSKKPSNQA
jgi:hypothetical protein